MLRTFYLCYKSIVEAFKLKASCMKMGQISKLLLFISLLITTSVLSLPVGAQKLNFEETVKYINEAFKENNVYYFEPYGLNGYGVDEITCKKDGKMIFKWLNRETNESKIIGSFNLFEVGRYKEEMGYKILLDKQDKRLAQLTMASSDAFVRIQRAVEHLKSLCNKSADPFAN
jgi:hypothetical protein